MTFLPGLLLSAALAAPDAPFVVERPVVDTSYPHERFGPVRGAPGALFERVETALLARALDHLIYIDMPPPPGEPGPAAPPPGGPGPAPRNGAAPRNGPPGPPPRSPRAPRRRRPRHLGALLLLSACTALSPPPTRVDGRTWSLATASIAFPSGWVVATEPAHFRSGLDHLLLEGRRGDLRLAVGFIGGAGAGALAGLEERTPTPLGPATVRRIAGCHGAVGRFVGEAPSVVQIAVDLPDGLLLAQAWGAPDGTEALEALVCGR